MTMSLRNANIGILVAVVVLVAGTLLFKDAGQHALGLVGLVAFFAGFVVLTVLDERERRRERAQ